MAQALTERSFMIFTIDQPDLIFTLAVLFAENG
jgi:hypothetical protein